MSYLALDSCQTACAGLWLTKTLAVTATGFPGDTQGMKLPLLLPVYALHPRCLEESLPLFGGVRLKETSILQLSIIDVDVTVFIWDLIHHEPVCLFLVNGPTSDQLESAQQTK